MPIVKGTLYYAKAATDWLIPHVATFDTADAVLTMSSPLKLALPEPRSLRASNLPMYSIPTRPPAVTVPCVLQMRDVSIKMRGVPTGVSNSLDVTFFQNGGEQGQRLFYTPKIKTKLTILLTTVFLFIPTKENKMVSKGQFTN